MLCANSPPTMWDLKRIIGEPQSDTIMWWRTISLYVIRNTDNNWLFLPIFYKNVKKQVVGILCSIDRKEDSLQNVHYTIPSPDSGLRALRTRWRSWEDGHTQWYPIHQMSAEVSSSAHRSGKSISGFVQCSSFNRHVLKWFSYVNAQSVIIMEANFADSSEMLDCCDWWGSTWNVKLIWSFYFQSTCNPISNSPVYIRHHFMCYMN